MSTLEPAAVAAMIPGEVKEELSKIARKNRRSLTKEITVALELYVEAQKEEE